MQPPGDGREAPPFETWRDIPGPEAEKVSDTEKKKRKKEKKEKKRDKGLRREVSRLGRPKDPEGGFWGTAVDPRTKIRKRVVKKAQKYIGKKKKAKSSSNSSGSSSSSSSTGEEETRGLEGVFMEETRIRVVAMRVPWPLRP